MSYQPRKVINCAAASGASTSSYVDLGDTYKSKVAVKYVTMSTGAAVTVYGAESTSATFLPIQERVNTAPIQYQALTIATTTSGGWAVFDNPGFQYIQFITSAVVSGGVSYTVIY